MEALNVYPPLFRDESSSFPFLYQEVSKHPLGFPCGSAGKESICNEGALGSIPGLGRSSGEGNGYPFQYAVLQNSMDFIVHGVTKSWTQLSDFHFRENRRKKMEIYSQVGILSSVKFFFSDLSVR